MMRKIIAIFSLVLTVMVFAQSGSNSFSERNNINSNESYTSPRSSNSSYNTFSESSLQSNNGKGNGDIGTMGVGNGTGTGNGKGNNGNGNGNGGNPGPPLPVDNYIPVLIIIALGIIVYKKRLVKSTQS